VNHRFEIELSPSCYLSSKICHPHCETQVWHRTIGHQIFAVYNLWTTGLPSCHIHCAIGYQVGGALENWPNFQTPLLLMKLWDLLENMCVRVDLKFEQKIPSRLGLK
jgi:hypothetical protein